MHPPNDMIFDKHPPTLPSRYSYDPKRRHSLQPPAPRRPVSFSHTPFPPSRNELNDRIADSFKEFSVMLRQLSPPAPEAAAAKRRPSAPTPSLPQTPAASPSLLPPASPNSHKKTKTIQTAEKRWSAVSLPAINTWAWSNPAVTPSPSTLSSMTMTLSPTMVDAEEQEEDNEALLLESCGSILKAATQQQHQQAQRRRQVLRLLIRAACDGNRELLKTILKEPWVPVDVSMDEFGWTPLIYAACYGHVETARTLLDAGATIDYQDKKGWTALLWAASRRDESMVRFLIEQGASCGIPSLAGYTLYRETALRHLLPKVDPDIRRPSQRRKSQPVSETQSFVYYSADMYSFSKENDVSSPTTTDEDIVAWEQTIQSIYRFDWDRCRPDQMFVFGQDDLAHIVDTLVDVKLPQGSQDDPWAPANILFLCCRFAHYHSQKELGQDLLASAMARIAKSIKANTRNIHHLAFWIANLYQLLVYFKLDTHLAAATTMIDHRSIQDLLAETFDTHLVSYAERQLERLVEPSMLEFCEESDCEILATPVAFADDSSWQQRMMMGSSSFRRNSSTAATPPSMLINTMTNLLDTLTMYRVHSDILHQLTKSCLAFCSTTIFRTILANKKYLSRSQAILIRMNVSSLEEWARTQGQQPLLLFRPVVQLLQFLQSISQLHDFNVFQNTARQFDSLTPAQIRHCVSHYRYEVGEPRLPATTAPRVSEDGLLTTSAQREPTWPSYPFVMPSIDLDSTSKHDPLRPSIPDQWIARLDHRK